MISHSSAGRAGDGLDTIVAAFLRGATAEEIVQQYPSLGLADVYAVIAYYLRQREDVGAYLRQRQQRASQIRQQNEARSNPAGVRERLLARDHRQHDDSLSRRTSDWVDAFAGKLSDVFGTHEENLAWLAAERRSWSE